MENYLLAGNIPACAHRFWGEMARKKSLFSASVIHGVVSCVTHFNDEIRLHQFLKFFYRKIFHDNISF